MKTLSICKTTTGVIAFTLLCAATSVSFAAPFTLTNGVGDTKVSIGVDGFGAFGSAAGSHTTDAFYDPLGAIGSDQTTFESFVAIRIGSSGTRTFLSSGPVSGLPNPVVAGTALSGSSVFSHSGLDFALTQTLSTLFTGVTPTGSILTQTYSILNPGTSAVSFELVRYLDGDLLFDSSLSDGGGRIFSGGTEILFETDAAVGTAVSTTFVGITATGGTIPALGRYEISPWSGLRSAILAGTALGDFVFGDGADPDQFIDVGPGYDVTLALNNIFTLGAGASTVYTTTTIFGSGDPAAVGSPVPDSGATLMLLSLGLGFLAWSRRK